MPGYRNTWMQVCVWDLNMEILEFFFILDIVNVSETVFIHPDTMRRCNIRINQPVLINDYRCKVIATGKAWPVKSLDIHSTLY